MPQEAMGEAVHQTHAAMGWCVPSACTPRDVRAIARPVAARAGFNASVRAHACHTHRARRLAPLDLFALCLLCFFISLAVLSTIYDVFTRRQERRNQLLSVFSVYTNGIKLFSVSPTSVRGDQIHCLNGIRFITLCLLVLVHTYFYSISLPIINGVRLREITSAVQRLPLINHTIFIDTFLFVGGLLLSFLFLKEIKRIKRFNIFAFYIHRYVRTTPALAILILLTVTLLNVAGSGPLWSGRHAASSDACRRKWWLNLLYVNNYVQPENMCLGHTWYLAVDMQLHWLSPLVLIPLWKWPRLAKGWIAILVAAGWAIPFTIVYLKELYTIGSFTSPPEKGLDTWKYYYWPVHTRFSPWIIGVALGAILRHAQESKYKLSRVKVAVGWIASIILLLCALGLGYPLYQMDYKYNRLETAFWLSSFHIIWALGIAWIIYACHQGYGGFVNSFLSWRVFQPLGRLSFGIYLTHLPILDMLNGMARTPVVLDDAILIVQYFGVLVMSIAWTVPLTLLFESPIIALEKISLRGHGKTPAMEETNKITNNQALESSSRIKEIISSKL